MRMDQTAHAKFSVHRFFIRIAVISNVIGASVLFFLVLAMNADVIARGIFHNPLHGVVELVIFALVLIVFMQLPDVVERNRLTRSDGFLLLLADKQPVAAEFFSRLINLLAAIFFGIAVWAVFPEYLESYESCSFFKQPEFGPPPTGNLIQDFKDGWARCDYFGTPGIFTAPWWPAKLAILFSMVMCTILLSFKTLFGSRSIHAT